MREELNAVNLKRIVEKLRRNVAINRMWLSGLTGFVATLIIQIVCLWIVVVGR